MQSVLSGHKLVEYKTMKNIFGKGPHDDARDEKLRGGSQSQRRDRQQNDCQQKRNEDFAEIEDGGHAPSLGARPSSAQPTPGATTPRGSHNLIEVAATAIFNGSVIFASHLVNFLRVSNIDQCLAPRRTQAGSSPLQSSTESSVTFPPNQWSRLWPIIERILLVKTAILSKPLI